MKSIHKNALILLLGNAAALILEVLPFGAVLIFASPDGENVRRTFSYFDLTPYGYANAGPFITAVLTCVLFILSAVCLITGKKAPLKAVSILSLISLTASLAPLFFGIRYFTLTALFISLILIIVFILSVIFQKQSKK